MNSAIGLGESLKEKFNIKVYGNYPINAYNIESVLELSDYDRLSISPELYKKNIKDLMEDYYKELIKDNNINEDNELSKNNNANKNHELSENNCKIPELELLVHGNIESMTTRKELISKKQLKLIRKYNKKQTKKNSLNQHNDDYYIDSNEYYLKNRKDQYYPIKTNLNEDNIIILNSEEFCLIDEIAYLKSIGLTKFSIDARWKSLDYILEIGKVYRDIIDEKTPSISESKKTNDLGEAEKTIAKYCPNLTKGNFDTGLK